MSDRCLRWASSLPGGGSTPRPAPPSPRGLDIAEQRQSVVCAHHGFFGVQSRRVELRGTSRSWLVALAIGRERGVGRAANGRLCASAQVPPTELTPVTARCLAARVPDTLAISGSSPLLDEDMRIAGLAHGGPRKASSVSTARIVLGRCDGLERCADAIGAKWARRALGCWDEKSRAAATVVVVRLWLRWRLRLG